MKLTSKAKIYFFILFLPVLLSACQPKTAVCPPMGPANYLSAPPDAKTPVSSSKAVSAPISLVIDNKPEEVDRVVEGPVCNDSWKGTVYVSCNIQVVQWKDNPLFLNNCNLNIEPDTVVYVAHHNNTAYYNGCSCHSRE